MQSIRATYNKAMHQAGFAGAEQAARAPDSADNLAVDQYVLFQAVAGVRLRRLLEVFDRPLFDVIVTLVMVVSEPCRRISFFFQVAAEGRLRRNNPMMAELAWPPVSPVTAAMQYMSCLMRGTAPALRMVWQKRGYGTAQEVIVSRMVYLKRILYHMLVFFRCESFVDYVYHRMRSILYMRAR